jgi:hypothetical protein
MAMITSKLLWTLPVAMLTALVGCSGTENVPPTASTPSAVVTSMTPTPAGSSDAERMAAIVPTYTAMWAAVDDLQDAGGVGAPTKAMQDTMTAANILSLIHI